MNIDFHLFLEILRSDPRIINIQDLECERSNRVVYKIRTTEKSTLMEATNLDDTIRSSEIEFHLQKLGLLDLIQSLAS